jgi:hypothetical protein
MGAPFSGTRVFTGPGTLYVAPLGTVEPSTITGAWSGWTAIGYTDKGNIRSWKPSFAEVTVDEELFPIRNVPDKYAGTVKFAFAERTAQNFQLALNSGIGSSLDAASTGLNADGSTWVEPPTPGAEVRIMIGWDALPKGATSAAYFDQGFGRTIYRQCINTEGVEETHQKGAVKAMFEVTFTIEVPTVAPQAGLPPFRDIFPATLAA